MVILIDTIFHVIAYSICSYVLKFRNKRIAKKNIFATNHIQPHSLTQKRETLREASLFLFILNRCLAINLF